MAVSNYFYKGFFAGPDVEALQGQIRSGKYNARSGTGHSRVPRLDLETASRHSEAPSSHSSRLRAPRYEAGTNAMVSEENNAPNQQRRERGPVKGHVPVGTAAYMPRPSARHTPRSTPRQQTPRQQTPRQGTPRQHTPRQGTPRSQTPRENNQWMEVCRRTPREYDAPTTRSDRAVQTKPKTPRDCELRATPNYQNIKYEGDLLKMPRPQFKSLDAKGRRFRRDDPPVPAEIWEMDAAFGEREGEVNPFDGEEGRNHHARHHDRRRTSVDVGRDDHLHGKPLNSARGKCKGAKSSIQGDNEFQDPEELDPWTLKPRIMSAGTRLVPPPDPVYDQIPQTARSDMTTFDRIGCQVKVVKPSSSHYKDHFLGDSEGPVDRQHHFKRDNYKDYMEAYVQQVNLFSNAKR